VMLRQSQLSTFASITEWFHGSALRLSEDDGWGFYSPAFLALGGHALNTFSQSPLSGSMLQSILSPSSPSGSTRGPIPWCCVNYNSQRLLRLQIGIEIFEKFGWAKLRTKTALKLCSAGEFAHNLNVKFVPATEVW